MTTMEVATLKRSELQAAARGSRSGRRVRPSAHAPRERSLRRAAALLERVAVARHEPAAVGTHDDQGSEAIELASRRNSGESTARDPEAPHRGAPGHGGRSLLADRASVAPSAG